MKKIKMDPAFTKVSQQSGGIVDDEGKWAWTENQLTTLLWVLKKHGIHELITDGELPRRHEPAWNVVYDDPRMIAIAAAQHCTDSDLARRIIYKKAKALWRKRRF